MLNVTEKFKTYTHILQKKKKKILNQAIAHLKSIFT